MKSKAKKIVFIIILCLLFIFGISYTISNMVFVPTHITLVKECEDSRIVVDDDDSNIRVLQTNGKNKILSEITYSKIDDKNYELPTGLMESDGEYYLENYSNRIGVTEGEYTIYKIDFEKQELKKVFSYSKNKVSDFAEEYDMKLLDYTFRISDGRFYLDCIVYNEESDVVEYAVERVYCDGDNYSIYDSFSLNEDAYNIFLDEESNGIFLDAYENIHSILNGDDKIISNNLYCFFTRINDNNKVAAVNTTDDTVDVFDLSSGSISSLNGSLSNYLNDRGTTVEEISSIGIYSTDKYSIGIYDGKKASVIVGNGSSVTSYDSFYRNGVFTVVIKCVFCLLLSLIVSAVITWLIFKIRKSGSVVTKVVAVSVPIMIVFDIVVAYAIGYILSRQNTQLLYDNMQEQADRVCALSICDNVSDFNGFSFENIENNEKNWLVYSNISMLNSTSVNQLKVNSPSDNANVKSDEVSTVFSYYFEGIDKKNDTYVGVFSYHNGKDFKEYYAPYFLKNFYEAVDNDERVFSKFYDDSGQLFTYLIVPAKNNSGEICGCYLIGTSNSEYTYDLLHMLTVTILCEIFLGIITLVVFSVVTAGYMKPLKRLRRTVQNFTDGKRSSRVKIRGYHEDEITIISSEFNDMAEQVEKQIDEMQTVSSSYNAYFSDRIVELLDVKNVAQLSFNECEEIQLNVLYIELINNTFEKLEEFMHFTAKRLSEFNAFYSEVNEKRIVIMSKDSDLLRLAAAVDEYSEEVRLCLDKANFEISVVEAGTQAAFSVVPKSVKREKELFRLSENIQAKLIVTEKAFSFKSTKCISRVCATYNNEDIYELSFNSELNAQRLNRKYIENGVRLFDKGDLNGARAMFIKALKIYPDDKTAEYYISII